MQRYSAVGASLRRLRQDVRDTASSAGAAGRAQQIAQAASEAATNAIVHGYDGGDERREIEVTLSCEDGSVEVTVGDRGAGFRPTRASPGLGVGLALIAQLADELELRDRAGGGIEVWMRFARAC